jgi:hypothetical protein
MSLPSDTGEDGPAFQFGALTGRDRLEILALAGDRNIAGAAFITANQLDLTALGANVDLDGLWNTPPGGDFGLAEWKHVATTGRDQYVRVVFKGYLYPLGHRAVLVQVSERILMSDPANPGSWSDAVVQLSTFIKVLQPTMTYPATGQPWGGNSWPFSSVTMKTLVTPPLRALTGPPPTLPKIGSTEQVRLIQDATGADVRWRALAVDNAGHEVHISMPLAFMFAHDPTQGYPGNEFDPNDSMCTDVANAYNTRVASNGTAPDRTATTDGELIQYAPPVAGATPGPAGGTTHPTIEFVLGAAIATSTAGADPNAPTTAWAGGADVGALEQALQPAFYPVIRPARVRLPAAEGLSRNSFDDSTAGSVGGVALYYTERWVTNSGPNDPYAHNAGNVYMQFVDDAAQQGHGPTLKFPSDAVGGIASPNLNASGLSATAGLVSGPLDQYAKFGYQFPTDYFPGLTGTSIPQLLGGLPLGSSTLSPQSSILGAFTNPEQLPTIVNDEDPVTKIRTVTYTLNCSTIPWPNNGSPVFQPVNADGSNAATGTMNLTAVLKITQSGATTYTVLGTISPFTVNILGVGQSLNFIQIPFNGCTFTAHSGSKPDIQVQIGQVQFQGALQFVNTLEQFLEAFGGSGFQISVTPTEITGGFSLSLPSIAFGIIDISNLGMSASIQIPFLGGPALSSFSFASQSQQFLVTVCMFGGGGFITLVLGLQSVQQVSASIEFAGNFTLDIGIASGGISLTAGVYYNYSASGANAGVTLTGFVKLSGGVEVLGLVGISVELDLSLTYHEENNSSYIDGTATMSASVHVIFFSITVPITVHKQFTGSPTNDPPATSASMSQAASPMELMMASAHPERVTASGINAKIKSKETVRAAGPLHAAPPLNPSLAGPVHFADLITDLPTWEIYCGAFAS